MDLAQGLLIITSVHLLAAASPGPDFVLVSQQTLSNGKRAGLLCSLETGFPDYLADCRTNRTGCRTGMYYIN